MKMKSISRRNFLGLNTSVGLGVSLLASSPLKLIAREGKVKFDKREFISITKGEKQLFVDDELIAIKSSVIRKVHASEKLEQPVLEAEMPWEQGDIFGDEIDKRIYIYGSVVKEKNTGYKMWYSRLWKIYYATSQDGINWKRPQLGVVGDSNQIDLFEFHSPSFIVDKKEPDPSKLYKAVGSTRKGYLAAYSGDGINWNLYPKNPILESSDTITLTQDPVTGAYLAFHKRGGDPRVKGRQVFLSESNDMQNWSEPIPVMVTDESDHTEARQLEGGTHSEFYNMSAFPYANQWLGMVTHFRRTGKPKVIKQNGNAQSHSEGIIDVQLVHSRDGRKWERCSDRSPIIPLGPHHYDSGSILGLCNSPVMAGDEMWMYYTAMTTSHGGYLPDKQMSIARASWRIDGFVSLQAGLEEGIVDTIPFVSKGTRLTVNADFSSGYLRVEVMDATGKVLKGYEKDHCIPMSSSEITHEFTWENNLELPESTPIRLRFYMMNGNLYSYTLG